jgi:hypothetical protein
MRPRFDVADGFDANALWLAAGQFIYDSAAWTWWITLTFDDDISELGGAVAFRGWARAVARELVRAHVQVGWGWELQRRGLPAYHALLAVPPNDRSFTARSGHAGWKLAHPAAGIYPHRTL